MNANEFIEKVRGLVLNNAELNKTAMEFFREHPECWSPSNYGSDNKPELVELVGLIIGIHFHAHHERGEQIETARPWFSIDFGYSDAELKHSEMLHETRDNPGVYNCYIGESDKPFILKDKVNW